MSLLEPNDECLFRAVIGLLNYAGPQSITATTLLRVLNGRRVPSGYDPRWPRGPQALGKKLQALQPVFAADGVDVHLERTGRHRDRLWVIRPLLKQPPTQKPSGVIAGTADLLTKIDSTVPGRLASALREVMTKYDALVDKALSLAVADARTYLEERALVELHQEIPSWVYRLIERVERK